MFVKIDHIGIAVRSIASSARLYSGQIGMPVGAIEAVPTEGVRVAFLGEGETHLELLEPTGETGPVARFLERRGEGFHHLCLSVEGIEEAVAALQAAGIGTVGQVPRPGAGGARVAFLDPKTTGGILIELSEKPRRRRITDRVSPGRTVLVYLQDPKERFWGILREVAVWGVTVEGIELSSFDSWMALASKQDASAHATTAMFPSHRTERILLDRPSAGAESLEDRFRGRVGVGLAEFLDRSR